MHACILVFHLMQDLIAVKFTPIADRDDKTNPIVKASRYMCAVTRDVLGNSVPCAVLRPTYVHLFTLYMINKSFMYAICM